MCFLIIIFAALVVSIPAHLTQNVLPRANVPYPGPIPYPDPRQGLPYQQSVYANIKHFGLGQDDQTYQTMKDCLVAYGSNQFYDSWMGNNCGGMGWFKGTPNGKMNPYECYHTCASWLEGDGFRSGAKDYQCDFRTGTKGHCWMGYHPVPPSSTSASDAPAPTRNSTSPANTLQVAEAS